eukprot:COSAG03_NODE_5285_length_1286_cov_2.744735_1_plen_39_part_00
MHGGEIRGKFFAFMWGSAINHRQIRPFALSLQVIALVS